MARIQRRLSTRPAKGSTSKAGFEVTLRNACGIDYNAFWKCENPYLHYSDRIFVHKLMIYTTYLKMPVKGTNEGSKG